MASRSDRYKQNIKKNVKSTKNNKKTKQVKKVKIKLKVSVSPIILKNYIHFLFNIAYYRLTQFFCPLKSEKLLTSLLLDMTRNP